MTDPNPIDWRTLPRLRIRYERQKVREQDEQDTPSIEDLKLGDEALRSVRNDPL